MVDTRIAPLWAAWIAVLLGGCIDFEPRDPDPAGDASDPADADTGDEEDGAREAESGATAAEGSEEGGDETPDPGDVASLCEAMGEGVHVGETRLRRMTRTALGHTLRDLLGVSASLAESIELDESIGPFYSNGIAPVTDLIVRQYAELAQRVAAEILPRTQELAGCDLAADAGCADAFIRDFGLRVYRRPLSTDEIAGYRALYDVASAEGGAPAGFAMLVETMLQSPFFLYHVDFGEHAAEAGEPMPLDGYALASRLSYFLWNSMPDDALFDAAATGRLLDDDGLAEEVDRMLADPRAGAAIPSFHLQWLGIREMQGVTKEAGLFPAFGDGLKRAMIQETADFTDYVIREGEGTLQALLTADYSFVTPALREIYGLPPAPDDAPGTAERVSLDATQRAGLLTQAAFLAKHAHPDQTSPVHRGLIVRENLLCQTIPSPPPEVNNVAPAVTESTSTRERFARHEADPTCAACHVLIDPIGLGFENYDPVGAWRTQDGPHPVDARGALSVAGSADGPFEGAVELAHRLASSDRVAQCVVHQWFRFSLGRMESEADACTLEALYRDFDDSEGNIRSLLKRIVTSEAFTHVRVSQE